MLASPRYGERWGRYWLDLAGYADTESRDADRDYAWLYRDYVIRAFNCRQAVRPVSARADRRRRAGRSGAAPVVTQELMDNLVATGFLRLTPDPTSQGESGLLQDRISVISDEIQVFSSGVLGLTIQCAQCHDHKLEPIPQRDYYRLRAVFKGAFDEYDWMIPDDGSKGKPARLLPYVAPPLPPAAACRAARNRSERTNSKLSVRDQRVASRAHEDGEAVGDRDHRARIWPCSREELRDDLRLMLATPPAKRNDRLKSLAEKYEFYVNIDPFDRDNLLKDTYPEYRKTAEETEKKILSLRSRLIHQPSVRALWDRGDPSPTYIYKRGDFQNAGRLVGPGVPSVLTDGKTPFVVTPPWPGAPEDRGAGWRWRDGSSGRKIR